GHRAHPAARRRRARSRTAVKPNHADTARASTVRTSAGSERGREPEDGFPTCPTANRPSEETSLIVWSCVPVSVVTRARHAVPFVDWRVRCRYVPAVAGYSSTTRAGP